jgi:hypothetical protein
MHYFRHRFALWRIFLLLGAFFAIFGGKREQRENKLLPL